MKPVELTSEDIRIGRYKSIFEDEQTYYVSSLNELGEQVPNELYQKLFPNVAYIRWRVFENGKGLAYRYPLFLKRRINNKEFIAKVKAAADGVVTKSYVSRTYGEVVFIRHNINEQVYETVYSHLRSGTRKVNAGDKVKKGDVIGMMGSTGNSTGQHLHFEIHKGTWNYDKTNAVDPLDYINMND